MAMAAATKAVMSRGSPILSRLKKLDSMMVYLEEAKGAARASAAGTRSGVSGGYSAATWSGGFTSDSGGESASPSSSSSDDESSATLALRPRHSWVSPRLVISADEAAAQVKAKGSLLARIGRLEDHVVKLKADMKARELESKERNTASVDVGDKGLTNKMEKERVKDQRQPHQHAKPRELLLPAAAGRHRVTPVPKDRPRPLAETKRSSDSKPGGFLSKLLHPGFLFGKGCFIPSATSIKTTERGEQNNKDGRREEPPRRVKAGWMEASGPRKSSGHTEDPPAASHNRPAGKHKGLREVEVQRLLSLQGIQSFSTQYMQQPL